MNNLNPVSWSDLPVKWFDLICAAEMVCICFGSQIRLDFSFIKLVVESALKIIKYELKNSDWWVLDP